MISILLIKLFILHKCFMAHHKGAKGGRGHLSTSKPCTIDRNYYFKAYMNGNRKKSNQLILILIPWFCSFSLPSSSLLHTSHLDLKIE